MNHEPTGIHLVCYVLVFVAVMIAVTHLPL